MNSLKFYLSLISTAILLSACQNSGKSSDKSTIIEADKENTVVLKTADLEAPNDMKFISHRKIHLSSDITNQGGGPAYLSVYSDYEFNSNNKDEENYKQWKTNQNSRVLASSITHNKIDNSFAIPQHNTRLLVQIWFYDNRPTLTKEIEINEHVSIKF